MKAFLQRVVVVGKALFPVRVVLFLLVFAWYIQAVVDPRCVFFVQSDLFLWNFRFFRDFLLVPGGPAAWLGELILQACHSGWPGTLILVTIAWLVSTSTWGYMKHVSLSGAGVMWAVPAIVVLVAHSRYDYPFSVSIGAGLAMGAAAAYVPASGRWGGWQVVWFGGLCALLYYVAGAAFYVFASCVLICEFYRPGRWGVKLGLIVGAVAGRLAVEGALDAFDPGSFYLHIPAALPFAEERSLNTIAVAVYVSFPLCALLLADREARRRGRPAQTEPGVADSARQESAGMGSRLRPAAITAVLLAAAVLAGKLAAQPQIRTVLRLHYSADCQRWDEVLQLATRIPLDRYSMYVVHDVNMALSRTGRMPAEMFSYRQFGCPFVVESKTGPYTLSVIDLDAFSLRKLGELHLQLGRLNDAEFYVHESYVRHPSAKCLQQLTKIALAKGQVEQARLFLNVLRDDLVNGSWAEDWLIRLQKGCDVSSDAELGPICSWRIAEEDIHRTAEFVPNTIIAGRVVSTREQIASALEQNPQNRTAFEYLMAVHLVDADVGAVAALLPKAANYSYPGTPPVYEEAAMIYARAAKDKPDTSSGAVVVNGCAISEPTLSKIRKLDEMTDSGRADPRQISQAAGELGLAYFRFYYGRRGD